MSSAKEEDKGRDISLGKKLSAARINANLSISDVEGVLHISSDMLRDIESDSIDCQINPLFTKGYIKSYAALLKLNKDEVLSLYAQQYNEHQSPKKMQTFSNRAKLKEHNNYLNYASGLMVLLLVATMVGWWYQQSATPDVISTSEIAIQQGAPLVAISSQSESSDQPQLAHALFTFSQDCWIKVTDANKETIALGIKKKGTALQLTGVAPFIVNLGAANAVRVTYLGEELDISSYINGNTALFNVPLEK